MHDTDAKYRRMREGGEIPQAVFRQALADGLGDIAAIRALRVVFDLSLAEAKEVMVQAEGLAPSLDEYQRRLAEQLEKELRDTEDKRDAP